MKEMTMNQQILTQELGAKLLAIEHVCDVELQRTTGEQRDYFVAMKAQIPEQREKLARGKVTAVQRWIHESGYRPTSRSYIPEIAR
jgi:hypothetical protein